jgi:hypothetical protein
MATGLVTTGHKIVAPDHITPESSVMAKFAIITSRWMICGFSHSYRTIVTTDTSCRSFVVRER